MTQCGYAIMMLRFAETTEPRRRPYQGERSLDVGMNP
jgi:hypothetical protein